MIEPWQHWAWWQAEVAPVRIAASDTLTLSLTEQAEASRLRGYRGLDMLKSQLRQGFPGVIVRLQP